MSADPAIHPIATPVPDEGYRPGGCNIGPAEIAQRRRAAVVGTVVTVLIYLVLVALSSGASPTVSRAARFVVALPAAGSIVAWLQVWFRFCVAFGSRGVANFGPVGTVTRVEDPAALRADRARVLRMVGTAVVGGVVLGLLATFIP
ncbi:MAG: hypothetical protein ACRDGL_02085 [Candidatus Limnocylindrales bacterium]